MNVEERAELEHLRQQLQTHKSAPQGGDDVEGVLHRLKSLPEDEAVALLLELRSSVQVHEVSLGLEPGPTPTATGSKRKLRNASLILVMILSEHSQCAEHSSALTDERRVRADAPTPHTIPCRCCSRPTRDQSI